MKHVTKKILVSALVLGLSGGAGGVYAQAGAVQQAEARPVAQAWAAGRAEPMPVAPTERE